ncbi:MAG: hypothetical protein CVV05_02350 [Gammaproteobacteria bacterium HGW-Gammaproteobacteria-1]|jgi:hypothetical protein|nr:MAG: hypothetical protein CVV05_02350 [Gammaproteobacteria bacterium HGW-Gammaproteobacteria-1]
MTSAIELPGISKSANSPYIQNYGLVLEFSAQESNKDRKVIQGAFALPRDQDNKVYGPPHEAIVVTIDFDGRYSVVKPFEDLVALVGDVEETKAALVGYFQFDMYDYFERTSAGIHYVVSSLGVYVSNILQIPIE